MRLPLMNTSSGQRSKAPQHYEVIQGPEKGNASACFLPARSRRDFWIPKAIRLQQHSKQLSHSHSLVPQNQDSPWHPDISHSFEANLQAQEDFTQPVSPIFSHI